MGSYIFKDHADSSDPEKAKIYDPKTRLPDQIDHNKIRTDQKTKKNYRTFEFAKKLL